MKNVKTDVAELVIKMHQQLVVLEKKIDTLIGRYSDRPFEGGRYDGAKQVRDHRERTLYKAICAECNKECEVPFKPSQDRPVYCKGCFSNRKVGRSPDASRDNRPKEKDFTQQRPFERYRKKTALKISKIKRKRR